MNRKDFPFLLASLFGLLAFPAHAVPRIESVAVKPNPAAFQGNTPPQVEISVTIERPTPLDLTCNATVDPGDGSAAQRVSYGIGDRRTKSLRHIYKQPGSYRVSVSGTGNQACEGKREVMVNVRPTGGASNSTGTRTADPKCPTGWSLIADSVKGPGYSCRPKPPAHALKCEGGTKYFAEDGLIGCR